MSITEAQANAIVAQIADMCGMTLKSKADDQTMKTLATVLSGTLPPAEFLQWFATTLPDGFGGVTTFLPTRWFEIAPLERVALIAHEARHAADIYDQGAAAFAARYLLDSTDRASFEARAMAVQAVVEEKLGASPSAAGYGARIPKSYGCPPIDAAVATAVIQSLMDSAARGVIADPVARVACASVWAAVGGAA